MLLLRVALGDRQTSECEERPHPGGVLTERTLNDLTPYERLSYDDFVKQLKHLEEQIAAGIGTRAGHEAVRDEFVNWADDIGLSQEELGNYGDLEG